MHLKYSDVKWAEFRLTSEYSRLLRATEIATRYVFSLYTVERLRSTDSFYVDMTRAARDVNYGHDHIRLSYSAGVKDSSAAGDVTSFRISLPFRDTTPAVEAVSVRFRSPVGEVLLPLDAISCRFVHIVRDAVGYNEAFFFGGQFNVDVNNLVAVSDQTVGNFDSPQPDVAAVSEFVRVGIRHMVDFYLGGFAIGSVVFGGRTR